MKTAKTISAILITVAAIFTASFSSLALTNELGPAVQFPGNISMPGVSVSMCEASFWTHFPGSSRTLMSTKQINELNADNLHNPECSMNDLAALPAVFNGVELLSKQLDYSDPEKLFLNGAPVPKSYYDAIRNNIRTSRVSAEMPVGYGICKTRTVMRSLPESDWLADDVTDPEWDNLALSSVFYNEPVITYNATGDGRFIYVKSALCGGWVPASDIVLCHSREEWMRVSNPEHFIVVTGDRIITEPSYNPAHSNIAIEMGTRLEICDEETAPVDNRMSWYNLVVYAPGVGADGLYEAQKLLIPFGADVSIGYLPLTQENLLNLAFKSLGTRYGWGGSLDAADCSAYVREIYLCCGIVLPRNTTWQAQIHTKKTDISAMSIAEKQRVLDGVPAGSILEFPGHEMMYLGNKNGKHYVIDNVSSLMFDNGKARARVVAVNSLEDTKRANGHTWLDQMTLVITPFEKP